MNGSDFYRGLEELHYWTRHLQQNAGGPDGTGNDAIITALAHLENNLNRIAAAYADMLNDHVSECRQLREQVVAMSEKERKRIGRDLHDSLGQNLMGLTFMGGALSRKLHGQQLPEAQEADRLNEFAGECVRQVRAMARGLSPVEMRGNELVTRVKSLTADVEQVFKVQCRLDHTCHEDTAIDDATACHLYHIIQESVTNAVKHGNARRIDIQLEAKRESLALSVRDDGAGFRHSEPASGIGLSIMRHRAELIGGELEVQSCPGAGTTVTCMVRRLKG